jgi:methyl-accepting chemotaxis protein
MRQSMSSISEQVDRLLTSTDESASSILQLGSSIDEVANNTAGLHELVDSSTRSVHQMGASVRQVSSGAEQVQELAESTATAVTEMDRSVQEGEARIHPQRRVRGGRWEGRPIGSYSADRGSKHD